MNDFKTHMRLGFLKDFFLIFIMDTLTCKLVLKSFSSAFGA